LFAYTCRKVTVYQDQSRINNSQYENPQSRRFAPAVLSPLKHGETLMAPSIQGQQTATDELSAEAEHSDFFHRTEALANM
jgi:hypothetical protein